MHRKNKLRFLGLEPGCKGGPCLSFGGYVNFAPSAATDPEPRAGHKTTAGGSNNIHFHMLAQ